MIDFANTLHKEITKPSNNFLLRSYPPKLLRVGVDSGTRGTTLRHGISKTNGTGNVTSSFWLTCVLCREMWFEGIIGITFYDFRQWYQVLPGAIRICPQPILSPMQAHGEQKSTKHRVFESIKVGKGMINLDGVLDWVESIPLKTVLR